MLYTRRDAVKTLTHDPQPHSSFKPNRYAHLDFLLSFGSFMANI